MKKYLLFLSTLLISTCATAAECHKLQGRKDLPEEVAQLLIENDIEIRKAGGNSD